MAGVDVLGVLDGEIASHESEVLFCRTESNLHTAREIETYQLAPLRAARAAVAELIEAARRAGRSAVVMHDDRQREVVCIQPADWTALAAALRNVQGGA